MTHVDNLGLITNAQVVENGGFREVTKLSTIVNTIELGRVHPVCVVLLDNLFLKS